MQNRGMKTSRITIHGIAACDTVKKARAWLLADDIAHDFHDFRKLGVRWADGRVTVGFDEAVWRARTRLHRAASQSNMSKPCASTLMKARVKSASTA